MERVERKAQKLHGRAFYESIGSPTMVLAPMVEQSEFAWRMLTRSFVPPEKNNDLVAYTPMFHSRMFTDTPKYRESHFQPLRNPLPSPPDAYHASQYSEADQYLDGNTSIDRPLFVQFCANKPEELLLAAQHVQPFCDAVDLNLGCPQGIAKRGHYGSFLQEDWDTIYNLINTLHVNLDIPVTAKMRILDTKEKTLDYAKMILSAGASILTVHGRQRHQKGHNTGLADWKMIRYLRNNLPPETVLFANGNILRHDDIAACLEATGADGVMSAEGNLYDPTIFAAPPPPGQEGREYWRGRDGKGGWRMDAVLRRYLDIIHRYVLGQEPPQRLPLFMPSDVHVNTFSSAPEALENGNPSLKREAPEKPAAEDLENRGDDDNASNNLPATQQSQHQARQDQEDACHSGDACNEKDQNQQQDKEPASKKQKISKAEKRKSAKGTAGVPCTSPNLVSMQAHLFHLLRPLVSTHIPVRDALARCRSGDIPAFENVLSMVEGAVRLGLLEYEKQQQQQDATEKVDNEETLPKDDGEGEEEAASSKQDATSSLATVRDCKRPWFICQPYVRPLPEEALQKGSMQLSKKEKKKQQQQQQQKQTPKEEEEVEKKKKEEQEAIVQKEDDVKRDEMISG